MKLFNLQRRISLAIVLAILTSGIVVSVTVAYPLVTELYQQTIRLTRSSVDLKAFNIQQVYDHQLAVAKQVSSRSRIAYKLKELAEEATTRKEAQAFIEPKLKHGMSVENDIFAIIELDADGKPLVTINESSASLPLVKSTDAVFNFIEIQTPDVSASMTSRFITPIKMGDRVVGYSIVFFKPKQWVTALDYLPSAETCFINDKTKERIALAGQKLIASKQEACLRGRGKVEELRPNDAYLVTLGSGDRFVSYDRDITIDDWKLMLNIPVPVMFKDVINKAVWGGLALLGLSLFFSWLGIRIIKPLTRTLIEQSSQIAQSANELKVSNLAFEQSEGLLVITTADLTIYRANRSFAALLNRRPQKLYKQPLIHLLDSEFCNPKAFSEQLIKDSVWQGEVWLKQDGADSLPCLLTASPVRDEDGHLNYYVMTFTDISERLAEEDALTEQVNHDELTHLFNRSAFDRHLEKYLQQAKVGNRRFAILFMDLDKFKPVNDTYGHDAGDELLCQVATRMENSLRKSDMIARRGGDEFVVCTSFLDEPQDEALRIASKIHSEMNRPFVLKQAQVTIGISIGIAIYPEHGSSAELLLKAADKAMYQVKERQRNSILIAESDKLHP
ncbi:sensor domain-containing diguanylate cyclase [Idiomarina piscisalsi]|uniref:sensor domain-containing diguanylate cyclase n=1 Tax=Idiomarina piscisalsi TaxID=1096243 RepID=UPI00137EE08F|nr:sensor domain-containing diguanylate cyclase [Idiomarina piscisalsi]MTJ01151.1 sensor domain-containing diguanylate cyclase [Idiomarina piscisalsi]